MYDYIVIDWMVRPFYPSDEIISSSGIAKRAAGYTGGHDTTTGQKFFTLGISE